LAADAEVERPRRPSDHRSARDGVASGHEDLGQAHVRRSEPVGVVDGCDETTRDRTGEGDTPRADRGDRRPGKRPVLDAPVAREPRLRRRSERIDDRRRGGRSVDLHARRSRKVAPPRRSREVERSDRGGSSEGNEAGERPDQDDERS
jgi:hypothetical protein